MRGGRHGYCGSSTSSNSNASEMVIADDVDLTNATGVVEGEWGLVPWIIY